MNLFLFNIQLNSIRVVGGEGVLINPKGMTVDRYAWGLGKKRNNQVEVYYLFFGLIIAKQRGITVMNIHLGGFPHHYKTHGQQ